VTHVLITGGGGFLGQKLALKLAEQGKVGGLAIQSMTLVDVVAPKPVDAPFKTRAEILDISDPQAVQGLFKDTFDTIYHLAAVVSGQAEAEFDVGLQVNLFGTLNMLQAARMQDARIGRPAKFIYARDAASSMDAGYVCQPSAFVPAKPMRRPLPSCRRSFATPCKGMRPIVRWGAITRSGTLLRARSSTI